MHHISYYDTPLGQILIAADDVGVTGLWFVGQKYFARTLPDNYITSDNQILRDTKNWLDTYFRGIAPIFTPPLNPNGSKFQRRVWAALSTIPYGHTVTYGDIAKQIGCASPRTVGTAIGHNPISIIIPCHRVIGANGKITGYAAGPDRKIKLLELENIYLHRY